MKLDFYYQGIPDKLTKYEEKYEEIKSRYNLRDDQIAYIGDDIIDLSIFNKCGLSASPQDTRIYIKKHEYYITPLKGGEGALRGFADFILQEQEILNKIIEEQLKRGDS